LPAGGGEPAQGRADQGVGGGGGLGAGGAGMRGGGGGVVGGEAIAVDQEGDGGGASARRAGFMVSSGLAAPFGLVNSACEAGVAAPFAGNCASVAAPTGLQEMTQTRRHT
jgi:hypothetical protein